MITEKQKQDATVLVCLCCHWLAPIKEWRASEHANCRKCRLCDADYTIADLKVFRADGDPLVDYCSIDDDEDTYTIDD